MHTFSCCVLSFAVFSGGAAALDELRPLIRSEYLGASDSSSLAQVFSNRHSRIIPEGSHHVAGCVDNSTFVDEQGHNCEYWRGRIGICDGCGFAASLRPGLGTRPYTPNGQREILGQCCASCTSYRSTEVWGANVRRHQSLLGLAIVSIAVACAVDSRAKRQGHYTRNKHEDEWLFMNKFARIVLLAFVLLLAGGLITVAGKYIGDDAVNSAAESRRHFPWISQGWGNHQPKDVCAIQAQRVMLHGTPDSFLLVFAAVLVSVYFLSDARDTRTQAAETEPSTYDVARFWCSEFPPSENHLRSISFFYMCLLLLLMLKLTMSAQNPLATPETLLNQYPSMDESTSSWLQTIRNMLLLTWTLAIFALVKCGGMQPGSLAIALVAWTSLLYTYLAYLQYEVFREIHFLPVVWAMLASSASLFGTISNQNSSWLRKFVACNGLFPMYFCSGVMKLRVTGLQWAQGSVLLTELLKYRFSSFVPFLNTLVIDSPVILSMICSGTMALELFFSWFLVLTPSRLTRQSQLLAEYPLLLVKCFFLGAVAFHGTIFIMVGANFSQPLCVYLLFFNPPSLKSPWTNKGDAMDADISSLPSCTKRTATAAAAATLHAWRSVFAYMVFSGWFLILLPGVCQRLQLVHEKPHCDAFPWTDWSLYSTALPLGSAPWEKGVQT